MDDKLLRLLRLINILVKIQAKPGVTAKELAEKCDTTKRTIYRDIDYLSGKFPITNLGHGKGYNFVGNFSIIPLDWNEQESLAFSLLPDIYKANKSLFPKGFESAYDKVISAYNKNKKDNTDVVNKVTNIIQLGTPVYYSDKNNFLLQIIQAIISSKSIKAIYHTQSRNIDTERIIDPYYLVPREQRFYLIGYCHSAKEVRTFRISRFNNVEILEKTYSMNDFNIKSYLSNTWSIERGNNKINFKIIFNNNVARYIKEEELFVKPKLTNLENGKLLFEVTVNNDREFLAWLYQYGSNAEIIEPIEYRNKIKNELLEWYSLYN